MSEVQTILKSLDHIESKFGTFNERLLEIEQTKGAPSGGGAGRAESLGDLFVKSFTESRDLFGKTKSVRLELKAAADPISTTSARNIVSGGVGMIVGGVLGLQNALQSVSASGTSAVEYSRYTGQQGAAAVQSAEGAAKAAVRPDHSLITQSALTIAGYAKMSRQAMSDSAELKRCVDVTISRSVATALDVALVTGGTGFSGGYVGLATAYTSLVYTGLVDAISEGVSTMQTAGFSPDVVAVSPADWLAVVVLKGTANDHYLSGSYLGALPTEMRGLRVVLSPTVAAGKALLIDSNHAELRIVDGFNVEVAYDADDFTKNLVTVLGEMRVLPVFRTTGSMRMITPKAP